MQKQNFQIMYRDFTKNQIKKQGASVISLCELVVAQKSCQGLPRIDKSQSKLLKTIDLAR